jgi:hypothetical protein
MERLSRSLPKLSGTTPKLPAIPMGIVLAFHTFLVGLHEAIQRMDNALRLLPVGKGFCISISGIFLHPWSAR